MYKYFFLRPLPTPCCLIRIVLFFQTFPHSNLFNLSTPKKNKKKQKKRTLDGSNLLHVHCKSILKRGKEMPCFMHSLLGVWDKIFCWGKVSYFIRDSSSRPQLDPMLIIDPAYAQALPTAPKEILVRNTPIAVLPDVSLGHLRNKWW